MRQCGFGRQVVTGHVFAKNNSVSLLAVSPLVCLQTACSRPAKRLVVPMERETGLEPATACLEGRNSTTELLPLIDFLSWSGCADSNCGPPAPKAGALPTAPHPAVPTFATGECPHYSTPVVVCQVLFSGHSGLFCADSAASARTGSNVSQCYSEDYAE